MGDTHYVGPDLLRSPRLKPGDQAAMIEDWNDQLHAIFPTRLQVCISIGKRLFLIKGLVEEAQGHGNFRAWFDEQG